MSTDFGRHVNSHFGITSNKLNWRPLELQGSIHGLPGFAGKAIATDGIQVAIERQDGSIVLGHMDWFVKDKTERKAPRVGEQSRGPRKQRNVGSLDDFA